MRTLRAYTVQEPDVNESAFTIEFYPFNLGEARRLATEIQMRLDMNSQKEHYFRFNFNSLHSKEKDYLEGKFTIGSVDQLEPQAAKCLSVYRDWLDKVDSREKATYESSYVKMSPPPSTFYSEDLKQQKVLDVPTIDRKIADSGDRTTFDTGSKRDRRAGKGRYDLIPQYLLDCLAQLYEQGADKYDDNNWLLGQPFSTFYDSAQRHQGKWRMGMVDEPHLVQAIWNLTCILVLEHMVEENQHEHPEIANMGHLALTKKKE